MPPYHATACYSPYLSTARLRAPWHYLSALCRRLALSQCSSSSGTITVLFFALSQCSVSSSCTITVLFVVLHYLSALGRRRRRRRLALSQCPTVTTCYATACYSTFLGGALVILLTFHSFIIIIHQFHVFSIIFHVFSGFSLISMIFICTCIRSSQKFLSALGFAG